MEKYWLKIKYIFYFSIIFFAYNVSADQYENYVYELSDSIREQEIDISKINQYKEVLLLQRENYLKQLVDIKTSIGKIFVVLYKLYTVPFKGLLLGSKQNNDLIISYSLFNYYLDYLNNNFLKYKKSIKELNENEDEFDELQKQLLKYSDILNKDIKNLKKSLSNNNMLKFKKLKHQIDINIYAQNKRLNIIYNTDRFNLSREEKQQNKLFKKNKHKFKPPIIGYLESGFNQGHIASRYYYGIKWVSKNISQVISPFDGEVLFVGDIEGFGNTIIIKHAPSYMSIISGEFEPYVYPTQILTKGEPLGITLYDMSYLYYEIQEEGNSVDPEIWMEHIIY